MKDLICLCMTFALFNLNIVWAHDDHHSPAVTLDMHKELLDVPGKEAIMLTVDYKPGEVEVKHKHDAHCFVYVLEGSIVMAVKGGAEQTLLPGQTFYEGPNDIHTVGRNASKTQPAKFLVIMLKDKGKPPVIAVE